MIYSNGGNVQLDMDDERYFSQWAWQSNEHGQVYRCERGRTIYLANEIVKRAFGYVGTVDHKDRDSFNNRIANLRPATKSQNGMNRGPQFNNNTGYKGVCFVKARYKYQTQLKLRGVRVYHAYFTDLEEAARAYDKAAKHYHGEFAFLNFPDES